MARYWVRKSVASLLAEAEQAEFQRLTSHDGVPLKRTLSALALVSLGIGDIIGARSADRTRRGRQCRACYHAIVRTRRLRLRLRRPVLCRDGLDRTDRGQRLHLCLRHDGRADRLDRRLGFALRIRARCRRRRHRLVGLCGEPPQRSRHRRTRPLCGCAARLRRCARRLADDRYDHQCAGNGGGRRRYGIGGNRHPRVSTSYNVIVAIKLAIIVLFIALAAPFFSTAHWVTAGNPDGHFMPPNAGLGQFGWSGVVRGAAVVFFAYIGFDAVTTTAQEAKIRKARHADRHPRVARDLHRALYRGRLGAARDSVVRPAQRRRSHCHRH